jgi:hypothetical protein
MFKMGNFSKHNCQDKDSKKIIFSDSFETIQDSQIAYWAGLSPKERFAEFHKLMHRFYDLEKPDWKSCLIVIEV